MISKFLHKIQAAYKDIPNKKQYVEFLAAVLTIPVLLTVIWTNVTALRSDDKDSQAQVQPPQQILITTQPSDQATPYPSQTVSSTPNVCDRGLPEVSISNPTENETVSDNPVIIDVSMNRERYCAIAWSYRINGGRWSDYDDTSIALYNVSDGKITFELRVKNLASGTEKLLKRIFTYENQNIPSPTVQVTPATP